MWCYHVRGFLKPWILIQLWILWYKKKISLINVAWTSIKIIKYLFHQYSNRDTTPGYSWSTIKKWNDCYQYCISCDFGFSLGTICILHLPASIGQYKFVRSTQYYYSYSGNIELLVCVFSLYHPKSIYSNVSTIQVNYVHILVSSQDKSFESEKK